jgi:hypothetical protein
MKANSSLCTFIMKAEEDGEVNELFEDSDH